MKFSIRNLLVGLVLIIVLAVVFLRGDQLAELVETMQRGSTIPLVAAVSPSCASTSRRALRTRRASARWGAYGPVRHAAACVRHLFMNTIAPSLNLAGTTLVVDDARRRGISPGKATSAALLMQITIDGAFCTIMILAFLILLVTVGLSPVWFLLGMVVMLLVGCMIGVLVLGRSARRSC